MTSRVWLITALGLFAAVSTAVGEESPNPFGTESASRRAGDYFSRGSRTSTGSTSSRTTAKTAAETKSSSAYKPGAKYPAKWDEDDLGLEEPADETPADRTLQRLRNKTISEKSTAEKPAKAPVRTASAESDEPFGSPSRTPSGATLSRRASRDEESSDVIHATHETDPSKPSGKIEKVSSTKKADPNSAENPFVPVEEFLKDEPRRKPAGATKSEAANSDFIVRPKTKAADIKSDSAKIADAKPEETKPIAPKAGNVTVSGRTGTRPALRETVREAISAGHSNDEQPFAGSEGMGFGADVLNDGSQAPQISVRWVKKSEINVGQPCECDLIVKNSGSVAAQEVIVEAYFPRTVRLTSANPEPGDVTDHLEWKFPTLGAGEEQAIHIAMIPSRKGELATTARVRYTGSAAGVFEVEEPMLSVTLQGAKEVLVGDPASQIITVSNPGTGVAKNVAVEAIIPKGLEHPRGERLQMEVGSLGPGESRTIRLSLSAVGGGECQIQVTAKADANLIQTASADIMVVAPSMKLALEGPSLRYIGRTAMYIVSTVNDGAAPSNNVRVMHKVPEGFRFVRADKGGKYDESSHTVTWFVGRVDPGQTVQVKAELAPMQVGSFVHKAAAVSEQGAKAEETCETVVEGTAALQMEIVEAADPVEVGGETMYEIRLKNAGSIAAQNVGISCELASAVQLISAKGPSDALTENGVVVFKSLPSLAPGKTTVYRVSVRAVAEGSHRFRVRLASESITEPLISEELTKFYGE